MNINTQVYIAGAIGAALGTIAVKYFYHKPAAAKTVPFKEDISSVEQQAERVQRLILVWKNIAESYPEDKEIAEKHVADLEKIAARCASVLEG